MVNERLTTHIRQSRQNALPLSTTPTNTKKRFTRIVKIKKKAQQKVVQDLLKNGMKI